MKGILFTVPMEMTTYVEEEYEDTRDDEDAGEKGLGFMSFRMRSNHGLAC